jgi:hypothetical protein
MIVGRSEGKLSLILSCRGEKEKNENDDNNDNGGKHGGYGRE